MSKSRYLSRITSLLFIAAVCAASLLPNANAAVTPLAFSLISPVEFPPQDFAVAGLRVSAIYGEHRNVYGFDLAAIGNVTQQNFAGLAVAGGFNMTHGMTHIVGIQAAGGANINTSNTWIYGLQIAGGINSNQGETRIVGLQLAALANLSAHTDIVGAQVGLYNVAHNVYGFQIGLVNKADMLHGIQVGLINFNTRGLLAVSPFLNIGF
jgi:hypothetical protein